MDRRWYVRRIAGDDGNRVSRKKVVASAARYGCKCELWFPSRVNAEGTLEELFPSYVLIGVDAKCRRQTPCGHSCSLPIKPLVVDTERKPLAEETIAWIRSLESRSKQDAAADLFFPGQKVIIIDGPFCLPSPLDATFLRMSQSLKNPMAFVEVDGFLGRKQEIQISPLAIVAA